MLALYAFYKREETSGTPLPDTPIEANSKEESSTEQLISTSVADELSVKEPPALLEDTNIVLKHYERCGTDRDDFIEGLALTDKSNFSDEQKTHFERLTDKCLDWFNHYELLSEKEKSHIVQLKNRV